MSLIRLSSITLAMCLTTANGQDEWKLVCKQHCHEDGDPMIHNELASACEAYKHMLPKPRVYRICESAFEETLEEACSTLCQGKSHSKNRAESAGAQWCQKHKKSLPKPGSYDACMHGAHAGAAGANAYVSFLKKEFKRKREEEPEESNAEIVKEMELAAEIEELKTKRAGKAGKKVVVEEIRAEAEAAVEEIKEEVKAGKTDLDLAREAARAAFKAKQQSEEAVEEIDL